MMFSVLGPVRAWVGGREVPLGPPQQRLFLAALVLARGQVVGQRTLIDQLWDGEPPRSATQVLRTYVSRLRGLLGAATIASLGDGWAISGGTSDLDRFDELCTAKQWREALDLWQGDALDGLTGTYAETQRTRLAERRRLAEEQLADPNRPAQLPADLADFTGRDRLVADLAETLEPGATVAISAVAGIGGVGKTALAVHVAHLVRQSFPDGQLFADLRGAGGEPAAPGAVLGAFLRALGVRKPPEELHERAALFRSTLAGRRVLLLLDNAESAAQVRPLLPGAPGCAVLVTSRARLAELGRAVDLEVLDPREALDLLARVAGEERVAAERGAAMDLVAACGFLPLAIRIAGSRLAARRGWPIAVMGERLADERRRLAELSVGDLGVEASFSLGFDQLTEAQARAFVLLAGSDAADLPAPATAAVLDMDPLDAEDLCESLVDLSLLESPSPGRYRYHDLLKVFARSRGEAPLDRLADFLVASARNAFVAINDDESIIAALGATESDGLPFTDPAEAMDWLLVEAGLLHTTVRQLAEAGLPGVAADLLVAIYNLSESGYYLAEYGRAAEAVAPVARAIGDGRAEGMARACIAHVLQTSDGERALAEAHRARELSKEAGDLRTYQFVLSTLMILVSPEEAMVYDREALELFRSTGDLLGEAQHLSTMAPKLAELGYMGEAVAVAGRSVTLLRDLGNRQGLAFALYHQGYVLMEARRAGEAADGLLESVAIFDGARSALWSGRALFLRARALREADRLAESVEAATRSHAVLGEIGYELGQARALDERGRTLSLLGEAEQARRDWDSALEIFQRHDDPRAAEIQAVLNGSSAVR